MSAVDVLLFGFAYVVVGFVIASTLCVIALALATAHRDGMQRVRRAERDAADEQLIAELRAKLRGGHFEPLQQRSVSPDGDR